MTAPVEQGGVRGIERAVEAAVLAHKSVVDCTVVCQGATGAGEDPDACLACGMAATYPGTALDASGVCAYCRFYQRRKDDVLAYFGDIGGFVDLVRQRSAGARADHDCLLLFSGGKDSTYVLHRLVDLGLRVMTFTFDNGFISKTAMRNVEAVTGALGIEHVTAGRAGQNQIFLQSLREHQSVCNGCFRSLLESSTRLAWERGIPTIVTGLSRGQIIDERLAWFHRNGIFDPEEIDRRLTMGRRIYHQRGDDLDTEALRTVEVVDFYRYSDVTKKEIEEFLQRRATSWSRPSDTGFCSTNCMINDVGVYVHTLERGYHNYESPTRWEVRLGHLDVTAADRELRAPVDVARVRRMLARLGYSDPAEVRGLGRRLIVYYVPRGAPRHGDLREFAARGLPDDMLPDTWVPLDRIPRRAGVVQRDLLPHPASGRFALVPEPGPGMEEPPPGPGAPAPLTAAQRTLLGGGAPARGAGSAVLVPLPGGADVGLAKKAVLRLVLRHDALRLRLDRDAAGHPRLRDGGVQAGVPVLRLDLSGHRAATGEPLLRSATARLLASLDPGENVARFVLVEHGGGTAELLIAVHEMAADADSLRTLIQEVPALADGEQGPLPPAPSFLAQARALAGMDDPESVVPPGEGEAVVTGAALLSGDDTATLMTALAMYDLPAVTPIVAAAGAALAGRAGGPVVSIDVVDHTRREASWEPGTVGQLAASSTVTLGAADTPARAGTLEPVGRRMREAHPASGRAAILLRHFGDQDGLTGLGMAAPSKPRPGRVEIGAAVRGGRLRLEVHHTPARGDQVNLHDVPERMTAWLTRLAGELGGGPGR
ncbi:hypothetical protein [Spongiactinospora sp. 9N601]|uniref:hypothetical protein n=1 Tax=Spongiactinospora sp. 9N601 TaxID=3375149 RepID=UPI003793DBEB